MIGSVLIVESSDGSTSVPPERVMVSCASRVHVAVYQSKLYGSVGLTLGAGHDRSIKSYWLERIDVYG